jgi:hypothetical protein
MDKELLIRLWKQLMTSYTSILQEHPLYILHIEALANWSEIQRSRTGICQKCFEEAKTHFHHKNKNLIPENPRSMPIEIWYLPVKDIMYLKPQKIIENIIKKFELDKQIKYFGVSRDEVIELCPKCHRKEHSKK